jgi:hypothetical protein
MASEKVRICRLITRAEILCSTELKYFHIQQEEGGSEEGGRLKMRKEEPLVEWRNHIQQRRRRWKAI